MIEFSHPTGVIESEIPISLGHRATSRAVP
jgi:hypothetical protein